MIYRKREAARTTELGIWRRLVQQEFIIHSSASFLKDSYESVSQLKRKSI